MQSGRTDAGRRWSEGGRGDTRRRKQPKRETDKDSSRMLTRNILKTRKCELSSLCRVCLCVCVYFLDIEFGGIEVVFCFLRLLCGFVSLRPLFGKALLSLQGMNTHTDRHSNEKSFRGINTIIVRDSFLLGVLKMQRD